MVFCQKERNWQWNHLLHIANQFLKTLICTVLIAKINYLITNQFFCYCLQANNMTGLLSCFYEPTPHCNKPSLSLAEKSRRLFNWTWRKKITRKDINNEMNAHTAATSPPYLCLEGSPLSIQHKNKRNQSHLRKQIYNYILSSFKKSKIKFLFWHSNCFGQEG